MFNSNNVIYLWLIILVFCLSSFAQNESLVIKNLSEGADLILTGKVIQKESSWNPSKTRIYTKATLQVDEFLKGNNNTNEVEVTYPGGEVGDVGELYTHMPKFDNNEEVLVFLESDEKMSEYRVLNGEEGKITVLEDPATNEKVTSSNLLIKDLKLQIESYLSEQ